MIRKVHQPRWGVRDEVLSNLWPKGSNYFTCRALPLFCRKWRGPRRRGRAMQLVRAKLTQEQIDFMADMVIRVATHKLATTPLDRKERPFLSVLCKPRQGLTK